jgi:hypothetical protein
LLPEGVYIEADHSLDVEVAGDTVCLLKVLMRGGGGGAAAAAAAEILVFKEWVT